MIDHLSKAVIFAIVILSLSCSVCGQNTKQAFSNLTGSKGPSFYVNNGEKDSIALWHKASGGRLIAEIEGVQAHLSYVSLKGYPAIHIELINKGNKTFTLVKAGLKLGIDTYMDKYPEWLDKYFPTMLVCEKTHFYGYMMTPSGKRLGLVSNDPIASWSLDYNKGYMDPSPHWFMGHRIESANLDLLNALPLPAHNPQNLWQLTPGEKKSWTIVFIPLSKDVSFESAIHSIAGIPMIAMDRTDFNPGETANFKVIANNPIISLSDAAGRPIKTKIFQNGQIFQANCQLPESGLYEISVKDGKYESHGWICSHQPWGETLSAARKAALKYHQKASSHVESWYGFHSAFIAAKYFPDTFEDDSLSKRFDWLLDQLYNSKMKPKYFESRIQNTASTIGMLVDRYEAYGHESDLEKASKMADWLIETSQVSNGAYMRGKTVYTSVIYIAKSILELYEAEVSAGAKWSQAAARHYASAKRAIDQLVSANGDFNTEGELTFEDGMISCSALQIGQLAILQTDTAMRRHYAEAMLDILQSHDCLTQLRIPDARRRGGTIRFWEAQYDVMTMPNMICSPHGWSAWRAYATYYAYLLTGDERWLKETFNFMGAASLMISGTGELKWAFIVDPYVRARQAVAPDSRYSFDSLSFGNFHPDLYKEKDMIIGEQYLGMVSDKLTENTCDNDVHELFKCMGETVLTNAFIIIHKDGTISSYNCSVRGEGGTMTVSANEPQITHLHINSLLKENISFNGKTKTVAAGTCDWFD